MATRSFDQVKHIITRRWLSNDHNERIKILAIISMVLINLQQIKGCGDAGPAGIFAERDIAETPLSLSPNVRSLIRRSTEHEGKRKGCGAIKSSEQVPATRYV